MKAKVAIVGPGTMGRALAYLLAGGGYDIVGAAVKPGTLDKQREGMEIFPEVTEDVYSLATQADVVLLTTPDDALAEVAQKAIPAMGAGTLLAHTSGLHTARILKGGKHHVLSLHPLQAVANWRIALASLPHAYFFGEGDEGGLKIGWEMVEAIGGNWQEIEEEKKILYHAAAVTFSNFMVGLTNLGLQIQREAGIDPKAGLQAALPLMEATLDNIKKLGPVAALTGPLERGDVGTIQKHLQALSGRDELETIYRALSQVTLKVARAKGLEEEKHKALASMLRGEENG